MILSAALLGSGLFISTANAALPATLQGLGGDLYPVSISCISQWDSSTLVDGPPVLTLVGDAGSCTGTAYVMRNSAGVSSKEASAGFQYEVWTSADAPFSTVTVKFHRYWATSGQAFISGSPLYSTANQVHSYADAGTGDSNQVNLTQSIFDQYASFPTDPPTSGQVTAGYIGDLVYSVDLHFDGYGKSGTFFVTSSTLTTAVAALSSRGSFTGASIISVVAPFAGITPQVRRVSAGWG